MLAYTDENGVRNNRILVFDWSVGGFTEYTGLACNDLLCRLNGDVLGAINQYIIKFGVGYREHTDEPCPHGSPDEAVQPGLPVSQEEPAEPVLLVPAAWDWHVGNHAALVRGRHPAGRDSESALYPNFVWGISKWGDIWGFRSTITTRTRIFGKGHRVQVEFRNEQLDDPTTIYGVGFEFRPARAKGRLL